MTRKRGRLLKTSALIGATGAGVALTAGPAAASTGLNVSPATKLTNGQNVSLSWDTGLPYATAPLTGSYAFECWAPVSTAQLSPSDTLPCDINSATPMNATQGTNGDWVIQGNMKVRTSLNNSGHTVTCKNQCSVVVIISNQSLQIADPSGSVPITFK